MITTVLEHDRFTVIGNISCAATNCINANKRNQILFMYSDDELATTLLCLLFYIAKRARGESTVKNAASAAKAAATASGACIVDRLEALRF